MSDFPVPSPATAPAPTPKPVRRRTFLSILLIIAGVLILLFIGIQFIPVKRANPTVTTAIKWDSAQTEALAQRACLDCHSSETVWPWYSYVAPFSWLIYYDVQAGRSRLNFDTLAAGGQTQGFGGGPSNDLAYTLGQILAGGQGGNRGPGGFGGDQGFRNPPNGQFPTPRPGQQFPRGGGGEGRSANQMNEVIQSGQMPPAKYTLIHPSAKLTAAEQTALLQGLIATFGLK